MLRKKLNENQNVIYALPKHTAGTVRVGAPSPGMQPATSVPSIQTTLSIVDGVPTIGKKHLH